MTENAAKEEVLSLYESHYSILVRYASRQLGSVPMAEDIVQQSYLDLYMALRKGQQIENPRAWSFAVVRNAIRKQVREHHRMSCEPAEVIEALAGAAFPDSGRALEDVEHLFSILSEREEEALLLRLSVMSYAEIAEQLGISPKTVSVLLTRALKKLRKAMEQGVVPEWRKASHVGQHGATRQ